MQLSKSQQEAVETTEGQVILISCPGSGKTSTVIHRVRHMVEIGIPARSILVLTFSKAAAVEMENRYIGLMGKELLPEKKAVFSTIHAFCFNVICQAYRLSASNVLRESEAWMLVREGLDEMKKRGELKMEIRDYNEFTNSCLREISVIKNNGVEWENYMAETCPTKEFQKIYNYYEEGKHTMLKIDFDDMLQMCYQLFQTQPQYLAWYRKRFRYLIIDEFQDTNFLQRDILYLLAGNQRTANICVVGDDDQSIYKFRGAKPEIMLNFAKVFPNCRQIFMETNYRSRPEIIEAAKHLINYNKIRFQKDIKPARTGKGEITLKEVKNENQEIIEVVAKIIESGKSRSYDNMAVLYRNNRQADYLSIILLAQNIPFHTMDKIQSPYSHWIFSDIQAYWRLANGQGGIKDLIQVINKPNRFLPVVNNKKIELHRSDQKDYLRLNYKMLSDYYLKAITDPWKRSKAFDNVQDFFQNLSLMRDLSMPDFLNVLMGIAGYQAYLKNYADYRNMDITEFTAILDGYRNDLQMYNIQNLEQWLSFAKTVNDKIDAVNKSKEKAGITLSTMHRSKGLEWDEVFIIGANDGIIPSKKANKPEELEEERRLFYVAATRAKERLHIFWVSEQESSLPRSRFVRELMELPEDGRKTPGVGRERTFKKGNRVYHKKFGKGTVLQAADSAVCVKYDDLSVPMKLAGDDIRQLTFLQ